MQMMLSGFGRQVIPKGQIPCLCWRYALGLGLVRRSVQARWNCFPIAAALAYLSRGLLIISNEIHLSAVS